MFYVMDFKDFLILVEVSIVKITLKIIKIILLVMFLRVK